MSDHSRRAKVRFTRRRVVTAAATLGVGAAAASVTGLSLAHDRRGGAAGKGSGEALVVHVRDAKSGALDIFVGTSRIHVRDADLAARLAKAANRG
ncbi:MAG TPA: hypothetical protein VFR67_17025 [Pilimelia sp.]|nr:hypothetical protein [Pilimelia sp.]